MLKDFQKMIFNFTVKYLGWLKDIPFLPMIFESLLILHSYLFNRDILKSIEKIEEEVTKWPGISKLNHRYGGIQFDYDGKEIGHIHGHGLLDILFSKAIKEELIRENKVEHHYFKNSGWISFYIQSPGDIQKALQLLLLSKNSRENSNASI